MSSQAKPSPNMVKAQKKMMEYRERKDLALKPTKFLKETYTDFDGSEKPLNLRYYQVQGILHLMLMRRFVLGDDTGLGKCKSFSSRVLTDKGLIKLGSMAPQGVSLEPDTFYNLDQPIQVWTGTKWAPIRKFYYSGVKPTKQITTRRGYQTVGTFVHPLKTRQPNEGDVFVQTQNLKLNDYVCIDRMVGSFPSESPALPVPKGQDFTGNTKKYQVPIKMVPELASLLAYIVAEGWSNNRECMLMSQNKEKNPEIHKHIRTILQDMFGISEGSNKDPDIIGVHSVYLRSYFEGLGVAKCLSADKSIPWPIFESPRESVVAFLRAFFDSEGSVSKEVLEVSSASETLVRELQILLLRFGIMSSRTPKKVKGYNHTYWRLSICGDDARSFHQHIGFLTPRKQEVLSSLVMKESNSNLDIVPHIHSLIDEARKELLRVVTKKGSNNNRKGSGIKQFGVSFEKTLNNIRNSGRNPTYYFLHSLLDIGSSVGISHVKSFKKIRSICDQHFFYDPIVKIEDGEERVADIEVGDPEHSFVANGFVNHNTLEAIAALCYLWAKIPNQKTIILTTKSATEQWAGEFHKFTRGVTVIKGKGTPAARKTAREAFAKATGPTVLIMGYRSAVQDFTHLQHFKDYTLICDEATAFKNPKTQVFQVCRHMAAQAATAWGLTATLIKNNLMEGYGIYQVIVPPLFEQYSYNQFMFYFCMVRMQPIPRSNRQIPVIIGYTKEKIQEFKEAIAPYFLGRPKYEVASELPSLTIRTVTVNMSGEQDDRYKDALDGLLEVSTSEGLVEKEVSKLTAVTYCQEIVDDLELIGGTDCLSPKLETLIDLLTDGEFSEDNVIVFTRFRTMVDIIMPRLAKAKIEAVRITGSENETQREEAKAAFQNPNSPVRVACITMAGSDAINLQAAKVLICYDTPWSAGDFIQLVGRMIRIGSIHDKCYALHLVAESLRHDTTIDKRVMNVLGKKMNLIESVLGKRFKGEGEDDSIIEVSNDISDIFSGLVEDAKNLR